MNRRRIQTGGEEITLHNPQDFDGMRAAGKLAARTLDLVEGLVGEGVSTLALNEACHAFIVDKGAIPAPLTIKAFQNPFVRPSIMWCATGFPVPKRSLKKGILSTSM
jgi:methionyl aminopeptidase